jgi:hypothetical protein
MLPLCFFLFLLVLGLEMVLLFLLFREFGQMGCLLLFAAVFNSAFFFWACSFILSLWSCMTYFNFYAFSFCLCNSASCVFLEGFGIAHSLVIQWIYQQILSLWQPQQQWQL